MTNCLNANTPLLMSLQFGQGWLTYLCSIWCQLEWLKWAGRPPSKTVHSHGQQFGSGFGWVLSWGPRSSSSGCFQEAVLSSSQHEGWILGRQEEEAAIFFRPRPRNQLSIASAVFYWSNSYKISQVQGERTWTPLLIKEDLWVSFTHHIIESIGQLREASYQEAELKIYFFEKCLKHY